MRRHRHRMDARGCGPEGAPGRTSRTPRRGGAPRAAPARRHAAGRSGTGQSGFTLLEVVIAAFVLFFIVTSTAALLLAATTQSMTNKRFTDAAALAQRELEALRDLPFEGLGRSGDPCAPSPCVPPGTRTAARTVGAHAYMLERTVTPDDPEVNMTRVRVTVTWNTVRGPRSYVAETVFANLSE